MSSAISPYYDKSYLKPYNPDVLYQKKGCYSLFDKMRTDDQICSILKLKKNIIVSPQWTIESEDQEIIDFFSDMFEIGLNGGISKKIYDILSAIDYGFSCSEKVYGKDESGKVVLKDIKTRAPHSIELYQDDFGDINKIIQHQKSGAIPMDIEKFIIFSYQSEFDNPYGQSDMNEGVFRSWWSKEAIIKFWNIFLERFGMPIAIGQYAKGNKVLKSQLENILSNLQAKTNIVMDNDTKISFLEAMRSGNAGYETAINLHNLFIARAMLVPDLLGFGGAQIAGGSYALGEKHFDIFYSIQDQIRHSIECFVVNQQILKPLLEWNFGKDAQAEFKYQQVDKKQKLEHLKTWIELLKVKPEVGSFAGTNWALNQIEAPEIEEEIPIEPIEPITPDNLNSDNEDDIPEEEIDKEDMPFKKSNNTKIYFDERKPYRDLTELEKKADVIGIDKKEEEITSEYVSRLAEDFKNSINTMAQRIIDGSYVEKSKLDKINEITLPGKTQLLKTIKEMLKTSLDFGYKTSEEYINKNKKYIINGGTRGVKNQINKWIDVTAKTILDSEDMEIMRISKNVLLTSITKGIGIKETMKLLDEALSGYDILKGADSLERIARTNIHRAFNEARMEDFNDLAEAGRIVGYNFSAVMDDRTSDICSELDGNFYSVQDANNITPPIHFSCRSQLIPVFAEELEGKELSTLPGMSNDKWGFKTLEGK